MKIPTTDYERLSKAVSPYMPPNANERERWDALWRAVDESGYESWRLYGPGIHDSHVDTALRRISREKATQ